MCLFPGHGTIFAYSFHLILLWDFLKVEPKIKILVHIPRPNTSTGQLQKHREANPSSFPGCSVNSCQLCVTVVSQDPRLLYTDTIRMFSTFMKNLEKPVLLFRRTRVNCGLIITDSELVSQALNQVSWHCLALLLTWLTTAPSPICSLNGPCHKQTPRCQETTHSSLWVLLTYKWGFPPGLI